MGHWAFALAGMLLAVWLVWLVVRWLLADYEDSTSVVREIERLHERSDER